MACRLPGLRLTSEVRRSVALLTGSFIALLLINGCDERVNPDTEPQERTVLEQPVLRPRAASTVSATSVEPAATAPSAAATATPIATEPPQATHARTPSRAAFVQVGTGENHTCAVRSNGSAECWGTNDQGQLDVPSGVQFRKIASGWRFSCGITTAGTLACWGRNNHQQASPPTGQYTDLSAGWDHACAAGPGGATCWGRAANDRTSVPPGVAFSVIGAGAEHSCGLTTSGDLTCWGKNDNGRASSRQGPFTALAVGVSHTCVLRSDDTAFCQGRSEHGQSDPPATTFDQISAGSDRTCGRLSTGHVECWDARQSTEPLETFGPPGTYTTVSVGWHNACGLNQDQLIACWGSIPDTRPEPYDRLLVANVFDELPVSGPIELFPWPDGGLAIAGKTGTIDVVSSNANARSILDLTDVVDADGFENGFLSAAVDPEYDNHPYIYVYYTMREKDKDNRLFARLSRFPVVDGTAIRDDELIVLDITRETESVFHWGGAIRFGPDGLLYLGIGDSHCFECPQRLESLHGKILRIDIRGGSSERPYGIPEDNPMLATPGARPEIWAYGLRNPWRMHFDPLDGRLWVGEVGEYSEEEVLIAEAGKNYGWPYLEGFSCLELSEKTKSDYQITTSYPCEDYPHFERPIVSHPHAENCAIVGGIVYRGSAIPWLKGNYLFGDFCSARVWALAGNADAGWRTIEVVNLDHSLSSFGIDADGEVYVLTLGEPPVRLVDAGAGYSPSVNRKALTTIVGAPLDSRRSQPN